MRCLDGRHWSTNFRSKSLRTSASGLSCPPLLSYKLKRYPLTIMIFMIYPTRELIWFIHSSFPITRLGNRSMSSLKWATDPIDSILARRLPYKARLDRPLDPSDLPPPNTLEAGTSCPTIPYFNGVVGSSIRLCAPRWSSLATSLLSRSTALYTSTSTELAGISHISIFFNGDSNYVPRLVRCSPYLQVLCLNSAWFYSLHLYFPVSSPTGSM